MKCVAGYFGNKPSISVIKFAHGLTTFPNKGEDSLIRFMIWRIAFLIKFIISSKFRMDT